MLGLSHGWYGRRSVRLASSAATRSVVHVMTRVLERAAARSVGRHRRGAACPLLWLCVWASAHRPGSRRVRPARGRAGVAACPRHDATGRESPAHRVEIMYFGRVLTEPPVHELRPASPLQPVSSGPAQRIAAVSTASVNESRRPLSTLRNRPSETRRAADRRDVARVGVSSNAAPSRGRSSCARPFAVTSSASPRAAAPISRYASPVTQSQRIFEHLGIASPRRGRLVPEVGHARVTRRRIPCA